MSRVGSRLAVSEVVDQLPDLPVLVVNGGGGLVTGAGSPYLIAPTMRVPGEVPPS